MSFIQRLEAIGTLCLIIVAAPFSISAQEDSNDIDALFGDEIVVQQDRETSDQGESQGSLIGQTNPLQSFLKTETVKIGGSISGTVESSWIWNDPWTAGFDLIDPDSQNLSPKLSSLVYFDARPQEDFRVHGSFKTAWPFSETNLVTITDPDTMKTTSKSVRVPDVRIFELFSDFQLGDTTYMRFGKATVKWGVGYFFSPADIINLESIDILDPTAQREGPLQFRVFIPYGPSQNTLSFYTIFDTNNPDFETTALAAKAEFLLGNYELGLSGYYRYDTTERAALTLTGPIWNLDVFAEGVIARGSPKTFYNSFKSTDPYYKISSDDIRNTLYPSATIGFLYNNPNDNFTAIAQYYFNGEGYSNADRTALFNSYQSQPTVVKNLILYSIAAGNLKNFPFLSGQHYGAASISFSEIGGSDFSISALGIMNFSDISGFAQPMLSWKIADYLKLSVFSTFVFGADDTEYGFLGRGRPVTIGIKLSAGTGNF
ncbi:MAG: hypothetical protein BWX81_02491 [Spirochaetes bacterium ADurb.Bin110]|jgi:hypothetical protein|nr:MAG: hypothetical protein BWX81_02491 [Spirochaetes bacterium ADurb.Bin110]